MGDHQSCGEPGDWELGSRDLEGQVELHLESWDLGISAELAWDGGAGSWD